MTPREFSIREAALELVEAARPAPNEAPIESVWREMFLARVARFRPDGAPVLTPARQAAMNRAVRVVKT